MSEHQKKALDRVVKALDTVPEEIAKSLRVSVVVEP